MISTALALTLVVPAFNFTGFAWPSGQFPIPYCVSANGTQTQLTAAQQRALIIEGINFWRSSGAGGGLTCSSYDAVADARACGRTINLGDNRNNIYFERNAWQWGSQTLGVTHSGGAGNCGQARDSTGQTVRLTCQGSPDIELNDTNGMVWDDGGRRGNTDLTSIVSHEYGHFIGLDHCNENNTCQQGQAVMYAAYLGGDFSVPRSDDAGGACALYPGTPGGVGYPCTNNTQCTSRQCVSPASGGYCTASCGTCPTGYACDTLAGFAGTVCVRDDGTNRDACEVCQGGLPNACAANGLCVAGIPEPQGGRCVIPCPNVAAANGGCANQYSCQTIRGAGDYCVPRSGDCTNLNNFTELQFGQACAGAQATCAAGLECIDICTRGCTGAGQGNCPSGFVCHEFDFQSGPASYCAPPVNEGGDCSGFTACTVGPCLNSGGAATCYRDCAGNAGACNNAQTCETYQLQGGGSVSICEPPGVPPRPDAGFPPDTGPAPNPDATTMSPDAMSEDGGMSMMPDASEGPCACDLTFSCEPGCTCDRECAPDAGGGGGSCACDTFAHCQQGCACDADCPCACDSTVVCDPAPSGSSDPFCSCDPECYEGNGGGTIPRARSSCATTAAADTWAILGVLLVGLAWRRRDRAA